MAVPTTAVVHRMKPASLALPSTLSVTIVEKTAVGTRQHDTEFKYLQYAIILGAQHAGSLEQVSQRNDEQQRRRLGEC